VSFTSGIVGFLTDPTFGIPFLLVGVITAGLAWWVLIRTAPLPDLGPTPPPEYWRIQPDSRAFVTLQRGQYLVAVDGLGRRLGTVVRERFHVRIAQKPELDSPAVDRLLPSPLTLRSLVRDLSRAYYSAFRAEQPGWVAQRWPWLQRRNTRRASRDFRRITDLLSLALPALEGA